MFEPHFPNTRIWKDCLNSVETRDVTTLEKKKGFLQLHRVTIQLACCNSHRAVIQGLSTLLSFFILCLFSYTEGI